MSLLDDARQFANYPDTYETEDDTGALRVCCSRCDGDAAADSAWPSIVHRPGCPWLSMTRIVAALEAADRLVTIEDPGLGGLTIDTIAILLELAVALKGKEVPA